MITLLQVLCRCPFWRDLRDWKLLCHSLNTWLKIKEEAGGWPPHVGNDPTVQREHLTEYESSEGIKLNPTKIQKNPGLRTLANMMLNSFWGKFGQRINKTQVQEFDDPQKF